MSHLLRVSITCLCIILVSVCHGQLVHFTKQFKIEDGLAHRSVNRIIRDDQGKTWIFTRNAIQIYDGANFKTVSHKIGQLEDNISIHKVAPNQVFIKKDTFAWLLDTRKEKISTTTVDTLLDYLPTENSLYIYDRQNNSLSLQNKLITSFDKSDRLQKLVVSNTEAIGVMSKDSKSYHYDGQNSWREIGKTDKLIGFVRDSLVYVRNDSLYFYEPTKGRHYFKKLASYALIREDKLSNVLLATSNNPRRFKDFSLYTDSGILDYSEVANKVNTIRDFYSDNFTQHLLLATYNGLIYSSFSNYVNKYSYKADLSSANFGEVIWWIIERTKTGDIYYAKEGKGFYGLSKSGETMINPYAPSENQYTSNYFGSYHEPTDRLYSFTFKSKSTILHIWDFENKPIDIELPGRYYSITKIDDRYISFSGRKGKNAHRISFDTKLLKIANETSIDGIGSHIYHVASAASKDYIASPAGVFAVDKDSQLVQDTLSEKVSLVLFQDGNTLFAGTDGQGIQIFKDDTLNHILTINDGLIGNTVHSIQKDRRGNYWLGTLNGISVLNPQYKIIKNIRKEDGLGASELNMKSLLCTENKLYVGTLNGLSEIDYSILNLTDCYPLVREEISITDVEDHSTTKNIIGEDKEFLDYGVDSIDIKFKNYQLFRYNHYQDYIYQNNFTVNGQSIKLNGDRLPVVLAKGTNKVEHHLNQSNGSFKTSFEINRETFFEKFGALTIASLLILGLFIALYILNRKRLKENQEAALKALTYNLDAMRASALRAQMNPHFIFNALGSIQYYIQRQESEKAEEYLSDFSVLIRSTLESSKEDYTKISKELEMISLYLKLEHLRFEERFDYEIIVGDEVDQTLEIPSMVIQPYIENAINHGIYHLVDRKGFIKIRLYESTKESIICEIMDNGIGREASKKFRKKNHKSRALSNIQERLEIMNHLNSNELYVDISDRLIDGEVRGTMVKIKFG